MEQDHECSLHLSMSNWSVWSSTYFDGFCDQNPSNLQVDDPLTLQKELVHSEHPRCWRTRRTRSAAQLGFGAPKHPPNP